MMQQQQPPVYGQAHGQAHGLLLQQAHGHAHGLQQEAEAVTRKQNAGLDNLLQLLHQSRRDDDDNNNNNNNNNEHAATASPRLAPVAPSNEQAPYAQGNGPRALKRTPFMLRAPVTKLPPVQTPPGPILLGERGRNTPITTDTGICTGDDDSIEEVHWPKRRRQSIVLKAAPGDDTIHPIVSQLMDKVAVLEYRLQVLEGQRDEELSFKGMSEAPPMTLLNKLARVSRQPFSFSGFEGDMFFDLPVADMSMARIKPRPRNKDATLLGELWVNKVLDDKDVDVSKTFMPAIAHWTTQVSISWMLGEKDNPRCTNFVLRYMQKRSGPRGGAKRRALARDKQQGADPVDSAESSESDSGTQQQQQQQQQQQLQEEDRQYDFTVAFDDKALVADFVQDFLGLTTSELNAIYAASKVKNRTRKQTSIVTSIRHIVNGRINRQWNNYLTGLGNHKASRELGISV